METIFGIVSMVFGAVCLFLLSDRTRQLRETRGRLDAVQVNLEGADRQLAEMRTRQDGGAAAPGGADVALLERRLQQAQAEIERLRVQVNRSEERVKAEQERAQREIAEARAEADRAVADVAAASTAAAGAGGGTAEPSPVVTERLARLAEAERWVEDLKKSLAEVQAEARSHADRALELEKELAGERAEAAKRASARSKSAAAPAAPLLRAPVVIGAKAGATSPTAPAPAAERAEVDSADAAAAPDVAPPGTPAGDLLPLQSDAPPAAEGAATAAPRRSVRKAREAAPPAGGAPSAAGGATGARSGEVVGTGSSGVVLVIDGDAEGVEVMSRALQSGSYRVALALTAAEGLKMARTIKPTAIALDPRLSDRDGWELLADLRADRITGEIPLFLVGARKDRERAMASGATGWLPRGAEPSVVLSAMRSALIAQKRRAGRAAFARGITPSGAGGAPPGNPE